MKQLSIILILLFGIITSCKKNSGSNTNSSNPSNRAIVSIFAGNGLQGNTNGIGTAASFTGPTGITVDAAGNVYVADTYNFLIRKITPVGLVSTFAGNGTNGNTNGTGTSASFSYPTGVAVDSAGNVYVADGGNRLIRKITPVGLVSTFAGGGSGGDTNGIGTAASFGLPQGVTVDASGNVYVADENNYIRKITPAGLVSTLAGSGVQGNTNGLGTTASFNDPMGVAVDVSGNVYVADDNNGLIRKITPTGMVSTVAGDGGYGTCCTIVNGLGTAASFNDPRALTVDAVGDVYVTDSSINLIRKITPVGLVSTFAGTGASGNTNGIVSMATFYFPEGIVFDASSGNLYVVDTHFGLIRKITMN